MDEEYVLNLRVTYAEIAQGYTVTEFEGEKVYLKHYKESDILELDLLHNKYLYEAEQKSLFKERDRLKDVFESGEWSEKEEAKYHSLEKKVYEWEEGITKIMLETQREKVRKDLEKLKAEFTELNAERESVLGHTCESYTQRKKNEFVLKNAFFKDKTLSKPFFSEQEFNELETSQYYSLVFTQSYCFQKFEGETLNQVAAMPFFLNLFMACNDSVLNLYGKPLVKLTLFQTSLFNTARFYKSVLEQGKSPPQSLYKNPKQLVSWYNNVTKQKGASQASNMAEISSDKATIKAGAIISEDKGQVKDELSLAQDNGDTETVSLTTEAGKMLKETGKDTLNIMDLAKIHGLLDDMPDK